MPGPSSDQETEQTRGGATPLETAFSRLSLQQAMTGQTAANQATQNPALRLRTLATEIENTRQQLSEQQAIAAGQNELGFSDVPQVFGEKGSERWAAAVAKANIERRETAKAKLPAFMQTLALLQAEQETLPKLAQDYEMQQQFNRDIQQRLSNFITGKDLGVSPEERSLITQGISGISQDVATSRGLNRTDVPVMQAIAPSISQALLSQANANRSLFTGINQFQQGMGLSNQQLQAGIAGQNPAANLTGVYSGLRSTSMTGKTQQNYGALDYVTGIMGGLGQAGQGAGGFMYGMNAGPGTPPPTCWIAEVIYGPQAIETALLRAWLNTEFTKTWIGAAIMRLYARYGKRVACYPRMCRFLKPLFDRALAKARIYYDHP